MKIFLSGLALLLTTQSVIANELLKYSGTHTEHHKALQNFNPAIEKMCFKEKMNINDLTRFFNNENFDLTQPLIQTLVAVIACSQAKNLYHKNIITLIDYSKASSEKRLWVFDLNQKKLLFYTYVSHGINSGTSVVDHFSNTHNSKATSLGVYTTERSYYGRHGFSLKLVGHERNFNHRAYNRAIVMHSAWYMKDDFIQAYGRAGRSWGCPAIPKKVVRPLIETIREDALLVIYSPDENWLKKSRFLNCKAYPNTINTQTEKLMSFKRKDPISKIVFIDKNNNRRYSENEPIMILKNAHYESLISEQVPLERMLRRQINSVEYIALNKEDLKLLDKNQDNLINEQEAIALESINFAIPQVKKVRGIWMTLFKIVDIKTIKEVNLNSLDDRENEIQSYTVTFEDNSKQTFRTTYRFIRWLGL